MWGQGENLTALKENLLQYPPDKMVNALPAVIVVVVVKIATMHLSVLCQQEISFNFIGTLFSKENLFTLALTGNFLISLYLILQNVGT